MDEEKARELLSIKEDVRNLMNLLNDFMNVLGTMSSKVDDMLVNEIAGMRFTEEPDEHIALSRLPLDEQAALPSVTTIHTEVAPVLKLPEPEPPVPAPEEKKGIFGRMKKEAKPDKEKENRDKMLKEVEDRLAELKKRK